MAEMPPSELTTHFSDASGVSPNGRYAVGYGSTLQNVPQAVIWDMTAETVLGLGMLPSSSFSVPSHLVAYPEGSRAFAASDDGQIAVGVSAVFARINSFGDGKSYERTFIWTPSSGIKTPMEFLVDYLGLNLHGATISEVYDLSADGKTLLASGLNAGGMATAMLVHLPIPEPSSIALACFGLVPLAAIRRRR
ncbi:hypothetical protein [Lacipirellula limnantheis]|nr:hypothetical protein [Lacipirellula limnantheis]